MGKAEGAQRGTVDLCSRAVIQSGLKQHNKNSLSSGEQKSKSRCACVTLLEVRGTIPACLFLASGGLRYLLACNCILFCLHYGRAAVTLTLLCVSLSISKCLLIQGHQSYWIKGHFCDFTITSTSLLGPYFQIGSHSEDLSIFFWEDSIKPIKISNYQL